MPDHINWRRQQPNAKSVFRAMAFGFAALLAPLHLGGAQAARPKPKPPEVIGTLGPQAARALGDPWKQSQGQDQARPGMTSHVGTGRPLTRNVGGEVLLRVQDAPLYPRGGSTLVIPNVSPETVIDDQWYPTASPPKWRVIKEERPVQAWRIVEVEDVVCRGSGACMPVTTRLLARWAPRLRAYAFVDRVGRIWTVE